MKKTYIRPEAKKLRIYFEQTLLNPTSVSINDNNDRVEQWSQKKDNAPDIWSGEFSWGYDADE